MRRAGARAVVDVPCTCGELVQGFLDGDPFLVSCPIDRYSRVSVVLDEPGSAPAPAKALRAAETALAALGHAGRPFRLTVDTPLAPSKGFGTSTADVVGAIAAASASAGTPLDAEETAGLAVAIEPSDSTMFPGLAAFNHRSARTAMPLGSAPPLLVVVLEFGGAVDTLEYNSSLDLDYLRAKEPEYREALGLLRRGLMEGRWDLVGRAATLSARTNQGLLPKPELGRAISLGQAHGALGVCAAHSGTLLGVLFRPEHSTRAKALAETAPNDLRGLEKAWTTRLVDGGARLVETSSLLPRNRGFSRLGGLPGGITETNLTR